MLNRKIQPLITTDSDINIIEAKKQLLSNSTPLYTINAGSEDIIKLDGDKIPFLSFEKSGCTFCEECARVCPSEVLVLNQEHWIKSKFSIDINSCLAWNNVMCSSCRDACDEGAINFFGVFRPTIDMDKCTGCGFCYGVCPSYAVKYEALKDK